MSWNTFTAREIIWVDGNALACDRCGCPLADDDTVYTRGPGSRSALPLFCSEEHGEDFELAACDDCPVCHGGTCTVCYDTGKDRNLKWPIPAEHLSNPWALFPREVLVRFCERVVTARPSIGEWELLQLAESLYEAARYAFELGNVRGIEAGFGNHP